MFCSFSWFLQVFFSIIFAAFSIGMAGPNMQSLAMAQGAAYEIFKTIDLVSNVYSIITVKIQFASS
jgi:hypothetical protein